MSADRFISGKLRFREAMALAATALSSFVIIVAVAVSAGFRSEIRRGIAEMGGDVILTDQDTDFLSTDFPIEFSDSLASNILSVAGVRELRPVVYRAGIVRAGGNIRGVLVKGIEGRDSSLAVSIPSVLAKSLGLGVGDDMTTYFVGESMQLRKFRIAEIYENPVDTGDRLTVYAPIGDMRRLNAWDEGKVSAVEVIADDSFRGRQELKELAGMIGTLCPYICIASSERYARVFDWLDLIDFNVFIILALMILVAGFNMISGLLIFLFRNTSTIGMLKALGMNDRSVGCLFLRVSARLTALGLLVGNALALAFCLIQDKTRFIILNPENYFVSYVPVEVNVLSVVVADAIAFVAIMLLLLIPTLFIAKVDPAVSVRSE